MPSLRDLHCSITLSKVNSKLQEFSPTYNDGSVECFVAVPNKAQPFAINLTSSNFIAPGVAMYVFIDGVYQCNRNRQDLKLRKPPDRKALVDFCVRQKEERQKRGGMIAKEWRVEGLDVDTADKAPKTCSSNVLNNTGCIEVLVLRCAGSRNAKTTSTKNLNMDGANDVPDHPFGFDGQSQEWGGNYGGTQYDDREWQHLQRPRKPASGFGAATLQPTSQHGPPPPLSPRSYYAKTINSREGARVGSMNSHFSVPAPGYSYGTGPIPYHSKAGHSDHPAPTTIAPNAPMVDQQWLDHLMTNAVKKGVELSQHKQNASQMQSQHSVAQSEIMNQPPGAWPLSPFGPASTIAQPELSVRSPSGVGGNFGTAPAPTATNWGREATLSKVNHHVSWDQPAKSVYNASWRGSPENDADSWHTDEPWTAGKQSNGWEDDNQGRPKAHSVWGASTTRPRPREQVWESKEDKDGWTHTDAASSIESAWSAIRPESSISALATSARGPPLTVHSQRQSATRTSSPVWGDSVPQEERRHSVGDMAAEPAPYGMTFKEFMQKTSEANGPPGWGTHEDENKSAWKDIHAKQSFGNSWDKTEGRRSKPGKTIATVFDGGWLAHTGWKDAQDNGWKATEKATRKPDNDSSWIVEDSWSKPGVAKKQNAWDDLPNNQSEPNPWTTSKPAKPNTSKTRPKHKPAWPSVQDKADKGTPYGHAIGRPEYIDSLEKPYAVFRFKYRTPTYLTRLLKTPIDPIIPLTPTIPIAKDKLKHLPQAALIDSVLSLQKRLAEKQGLKKKTGEKEKGEGRTEYVEQNRTKEWVKRQSRETSEMGKGA